ncbi:uncharacterized protein LOC128733426, partial [Sabethes cyaneus]|uniref:uncharacterized protein LOC128733426 n=1 Tax=Sabethes cyaneus TaxID=53552 RepID=UPI00237E13E6
LGLPTFKSSTTYFWPILVNIHELNQLMSPLIVGIFSGESKPKDVNAFLSSFVEELNEILQNGLKIEKVTVAVKVRCFICDTPARSMLRGLRNDKEFRSRVYDGHHKFDSILEKINRVDMVKDFPIGDALHLIDLGITKRLLNGWKSGTLNNHKAKWSGKQLDDISLFLKSCKLPREFQRLVRGLKHIPRWKGTEFRTFLLYLSVIVLKKFFTSEKILDHFLNFYCAIQICIRKNP